jgi:hypothetical protein
VDRHHIVAKIVASSFGCNCILFSTHDGNQNIHTGDLLEEAGRFMHKYEGGGGFHESLAL